MPSNLCANIDNKEKLIELRYITRKSFTELLESMIDERYAAHVVAGTIGTRAAGNKQ